MVVAVGGQDYVLIERPVELDTPPDCFAVRGCALPLLTVAHDMPADTRARRGCQETGSGTDVFALRAKEEKQEADGAAVRLQTRYRGKLARQKTMALGRQATQSLGSLVSSTPGLAGSALP